MTSAARDLSEAKRCFVAYAAHELRCEITLQLALAEATLADPTADTTALREMGKGVVAACERQERLLDALLTLSRSEFGHLRREPVDLAATAAEVLRAHDHRELRSTIALEPARTTGDALLVERLVANLIENAVRHNIPGGARPRHLHRRRTRHLHDREHRTRDPNRRAHPPLPTLPATQLSRTLLCRRGRARARDRPSNRQRLRRHRHRARSNRRRPQNRDRLPSRAVRNRSSRRTDPAMSRPRCLGDKRPQVSIGTTHFAAGFSWPQNAPAEGDPAALLDEPQPANANATSATAKPLDRDLRIHAPTARLAAPSQHRQATPHDREARLDSCRATDGVPARSRDESP